MRVEPKEGSVTWGSPQPYRLLKAKQGVIMVDRPQATSSKGGGGRKRPRVAAAVAAGGAMVTTDRIQQHGEDHAYQVGSVPVVERHVGGERPYNRTRMYAPIYLHYMYRVYSQD